MGVSPFEDVVGEKLPLLHGQLGEDGGADGAGAIAAEGGVEHGRGGFDAGDGGDVLQRGAGPFLHQGMSMGVADEDVGERADLRGLAVVARALTQEYFFSSSHSVGSGSVSPFHGCSGPTPLYQAWAPSSLTARRQASSSGR
jgi:hypothetical protein